MGDKFPYDSGAGSAVLAVPLTTPRLQFLVLGALVGGVTAYGRVRLADDREEPQIVAAG